MSYGNGGAATQEVPRRAIGGIEKAPVEQLSSIHETTTKNLYEAKEALDVLLTKVRGSQPSDPQVKGDSIERHLLSDAYTLRDLSHGVLARINVYLRLAVQMPNGASREVLRATSLRSI